MAVLKTTIGNNDAEFSEEKDLTFTSERACLVELQIGIKEITTDESGNGSGYVEHNLGYYPSVIMFEKGFFPDGRWYASTGYDWKVTTTRINFSLTGYDANTTYYFHYRISGNRQDNAVGSGNNNVTGNLRISKAGSYDAETETDSRNMQFFSGANILKIDTALSDSVTQQVGLLYPFPTVITIPHNLGYPPVSMVLLDDTGKISPSIEALFDGFQLFHSVDDTNLYIEVQAEGETTPTWTFKYKITRDPIE
jgi:hypothetical protein